MNPQEISFERYNSIQREIGKHNDIQSALKEAYELIKGITIEKEINKKNPTKYNQLEELEKKFIKEYIDLENSIKDAIKDDRTISQKEREKIMFELSDIVDLAQKNGIKEHKNLWSKLGDVKRSIGGTEEKVDTSSARTEAIKLNEKKELLNKYFKKEKFSDVELKKLLTISNEERKIKGENKTGNLAGYAVRWINLDTTSADIFSEQEDVIRTNQFQDDIIKRIGLEKGYNASGDIHAFHQSLGNYITNAPIVESALKTNNVQNLGNKALKNYLGYLESKGELAPKNLKIKFGEEKTQEIFNFIKRNEPDKITGEKFGTDFVNKVLDLFDKALKALKEKIDGLFTKLTTSKDLKEFKSNLEEIKNYDKEETDALLKKFDEEIKNKESELMKKFIGPINAKIKNENEAEKIAREILNKIKNNLDPKKLGEAFSIIEKFNKDYDAKFDSKNTIQETINVSTLENERDILKSVSNANIAKKLAEEARKNGNKEEAKKQEEEAKKQEKAYHSQMIRKKGIETSGKILSQTSEKQARDIGTGKIDYNEHLEKILSKDENLRKEIDNYEKQKKEVEEKQENNSNDKKEDNLTTKNNTNIESYSYDSTSGTVQIKGENGVEHIILTQEEQKKVKNNPEIIEKIIDFYSILRDLGLSELWKEKEKIFTAISNKMGIGFNNKSNYLSENEIKIFLNAILKSVGQKEIDKTKVLVEFKNIFSNKNDLQIIGNGYNDNLLQKGSSKISEQFLQKYANGKISFDIEGFSKNI
ncbi:MAG: hypothetical protein PHH98_04130 [Candidatus Gracilibacteria bacterium]|nr:hypothetical protein [Candidatus Gracilibacteria bacterium]